MYNSIKIFLKNLVLFIKISRARYKRLGKCKQCGQCCKSIKLKFDGELIKTEELFEEGKKYNRAYKMFYINGKNDEGVFLFACKYQHENGKCKRYFFRPLKCWTYPDHDYDYMVRGGQTKKGCGFNYGSSVEFTDVMEFLKNKKTQ